jgi:site-specific DNA-methyltransferase (adenine-specific)
MSVQRIIPGDCIEGLRTLSDASVHCCVTSPPYWGLRDYGHDGQIGLESTPEAYVARMVEVFREVRRVLREDGTCWVNLGDSYCGGGGYAPDAPCNRRRADGESWGAMNAFSVREGEARKKARPGYTPPGLKAKDLVGIPWRVAFALQADGWWLRQDIIWHKPNPMPESVRDRCTKAHEYVFLLTKSERYFYDAEAVSEALSGKPHAPGNKCSADGGHLRNDFGTDAMQRVWGASGRRNRRSVWTVTTKPYSGAHFAVMPADLVEPCIKAGCPEGGTVLDPFAGSGTTLAVAAELGRSAIGCELNPEYIRLAERRIKDARAGVALFEGATA